MHKQAMKPNCAALAYLQGDANYKTRGSLGANRTALLDIENVALYLYQKPQQ